MLLKPMVLKQNKCFSDEILVYFIVGYFYKQSPVMSIVTFLMTIYKFIFLHNFLGDLFFCNCCSSVRMSHLCTFDVSLIGMSKTTLKQIANIKEFLNLLSINHQILFILHLFLISYI